MIDLFTDSELRAAILWFSKKSIEDQMKIISAISKGEEKLRDFPREEFRSIIRIRNRLGGISHLGLYPEEVIIYYLQYMGLKHFVAVGFIEVIKGILNPQEEILLKLLPDKLREYMEAAILFHFERIPPEAFYARVGKSLESPEMRSIISFIDRKIKNIDLFYREASFESLRNELSNKGFTEEQINALLAPMKTKIEELAESVYSKLKQPTTPLPDRPDEPHFNFIFRHYDYARCELNTFKDTYTSDMVIDPFITFSLPLSKEEMDRILQKMIEINFFDYPDKFSISVPPGARSGSVTPHSSYYFKVTYNSKIKELWWEDDIIYKNERAEKLRELIKLITDIFHSKEEFRKLPDPRAGYL